MGSPAAGWAAGLAATFAAGLAALLADGLAPGLAALGAGLTGVSGVSFFFGVNRVHFFIWRKSRFFFTKTFF